MAAGPSESTTHTVVGIGPRTESSEDNVADYATTACEPEVEISRVEAH